ELIETPTEIWFGFIILSLNSSHLKHECPNAEKLPGKQLRSTCHSIITMALIKEESEDIKIEDAITAKQEDAEEQTDLIALKEETQELDETEEKDHCEKHHDFVTEKHNRSQTKKKVSLQKRAQKTGSRSRFTCKQCAKSFSQHEHLKIHMRIH
ncbi:hypothetical protein cypCar_00047156, partial [Cyprinus carpio]